MKRHHFIAIALTALLALGVRVQSQNAAAVPKSTLQQLEEMKTVNQATLEKQAATLTKLDEVFKQAQQTRFLNRRG
jgi:hypothetical protein